MTTHLAEARLARDEALSSLRKAFAICDTDLIRASAIAYGVMVDKLLLLDPEPDERADRLVTEVRASELPPPVERVRIRKAAGVSLREMAEALGVSVMTVQRWETSTLTPRRSHAAAYARLLEELNEQGGRS